MERTAVQVEYDAKGIPLPGPFYVHGGNMSLVRITQTPGSTLKKKSNELYYHCIREAVAAGEIMNENVAVLATKVIKSPPEREYLVDKVLTNMYGGH